jgi:hypothetical protein
MFSRLSIILWQNGEAVAPSMTKKASALCQGEQRVVRSPRFTAVSAWVLTPSAL